MHGVSWLICGSVADVGVLAQALALKRDGFVMNRHRALAPCLGMVSAQTLRVFREGNPLRTFPDHA
jgi:hypothetical protein